jgi:hypothetical protein
VLYWDRFPSINEPRGVKSNFGELTFLAAVMLLGFVTYVCLTWRIIRWQRSLAASAAT